MGKEKQAPTPEVTATQEVAPASEPQRKYRYVGPNAPRLNFPSLRLAFRPATVTDAEIDRLIQRAPQLEKYFQTIS